MPRTRSISRAINELHSVESQIRLDAILKLGRHISDLSYDEFKLVLISANCFELINFWRLIPESHVILAVDIVLEDVENNVTFNLWPLILRMCMTPAAGTHIVQRLIGALPESRREVRMIELRITYEILNFLYDIFRHIKSWLTPQQISDVQYEVQSVDYYADTRQQSGHEVSYEQTMTLYVLNTFSESFHPDSAQWPHLHQFLCDLLSLGTRLDYDLHMRVTMMLTSKPGLLIPGPLNSYALEDALLIECSNLHTVVAMFREMDYLPTAFSWHGMHMSVVLRSILLLLERADSPSPNFSFQYVASTVLKLCRFLFSIEDQSDYERLVLDGELCDMGYYIQRIVFQSFRSSASESRRNIIMQELAYLLLSSRNDSAADLVMRLVVTEASEFSHYLPVVARVLLSPISGWNPSWGQYQILSKIFSTGRLLELFWYHSQSLDAGYIDRALRIVCRNAEEQLLAPNYPTTIQPHVECLKLAVINPRVMQVICNSTEIRARIIAIARQVSSHFPGLGNSFEFYSRLY